MEVCFRAEPVGVGGCAQPAKKPRGLGRCPTITNRGGRLITPAHSKGCRFDKNDATDVDLVNLVNSNAMPAGHDRGVAMADTVNIYDAKPNLSSWWTAPPPARRSSSRKRASRRHSWYRIARPGKGSSDALDGNRTHAVARPNIAPISTFFGDSCAATWRLAGVRKNTKQCGVASFETRSGGALLRMR